MANNIGAFFQSEPDREVAIRGVAQHLKNFWEPRMRQELIAYTQTDGSALLDIVAEAVKSLAPSP